jgi:hypothetical protein
LIQTVSTVTVSHPRFIPNGVFEYQHALGASLTEALSDGFKQWADLDLVVLVDALSDAPKHCAVLELQWPQSDGRAITRRAVLGPVSHAVAHPERAPKELEHPFCPCCFLTNTYAEFCDLIESDGFFGIRLLAMRNEDGSVQADCRINGEDWQAGERALCDYADTWPQMGFELRKQYVVLQTPGCQSG